MIVHRAGRKAGGRQQLHQPSQRQRQWQQYWRADCAALASGSNEARQLLKTSSHPPGMVGMIGIMGAMGATGALSVGFTLSIS